SANVVDGVLINDSPDNLVGGTTAADRNVISGNTWIGIELTGAGATGNRIQGNYIGLSVAGSSAVPNKNDGIVGGGGASGTLIGGTVPGAGNVVSGNNTNNMDGIWIDLGSGNTIQGNRIGTDATGSAGVPNDRAGVYIASSSNNLVGGTDPGAANLIA